jgi:tRNA pseudouridine65 synthase
LGSRPHGCNKQNKLWLELFNLTAMLLHAGELHFLHPVAQNKIVLKANIDSEFKKYNAVLKFDLQEYD